MIGQIRLQDEMKIISILGFGASYIRDFTVNTVNDNQFVPRSVISNIGISQTNYGTHD